MEKDTAVRDTLHSLIGVFQKVAIECIAATFGKNGRADTPWETVERLAPGRSNILTLGLANEHYQCMLFVCVNDDDVADFLGTETDDEFLADAFGEMGNVYCGMLMGEKSITERFGVMKQSIPTYAKRNCFFPRAWGIQGTIDFDQSSVEIGYAARKNMF
ncbi:MAG: hypothetical protein GF344_20790 [Chitinivibrionales bacterium]|nr:hypothetical protein [Chitinivibrionales bacterium]MBD3359035.1 hypothetical protein [Chitinivibrionales bacterium]